MGELEHVTRLEGEERDVFQRRFDEARQAGLTLRESAMFAGNGCDVGQLRKLAAAGCPPRILAEIVT
jgi:hypothetical protein